MKARTLLASLVTLVFALTLASVASAQSVSSDARGTVKDADGNPVANATVIITHVPSGTVKTAKTGESGNYYQPGLRVGGPYTIAVNAEGYRGAHVDNVYFSPGTQPALDLTIEKQPEEMEEIVVSAEAAPVRDLNNGVGSDFTAADIANTPSGTRDVISTLLRDPLAQSSGEGQLSVGGINPRFNGFAIDGSLQGDDFGLSDHTYATDRSPINLDAVESATLVASDYDVSASGFTGGLVNVTTKSGTNDWDGSVSYYWKNDSMFGNKYDGNNEFDPGPVDEKEYGVTLGGPIVKDKLFFFISKDKFESAKSISFAADDANTGIQPGFFDALADIVNTSLGYDPGTRPGTANTPITSDRLLGKLDWNITDQQRASFTYQKTEETGTIVDDLSFVSSWYDTPVDLKAYTFQLFSDWSDQLSTTLRVNKKEFSRGQICRAGPDVGAIDISLDPADLVGTPLDGLLTDPISDVLGGCDRFRHSNEYNDERLQVLAKADYFVGDHVVSAGMEYEDFSLFNLFVSDSRGTFFYDTYDDLVNGTAFVQYQNDTSNNANNAAASWGYKKWVLFAQDNWHLTPDLEIGVGLRYAKFNQSDKPYFDQSLMDMYGIDSSANLDGKSLLMPRVSFRWYATDRGTLSGGFGLFTGGSPQVWVSNAFQLPVARATGTFTNTDPFTIPQALLDGVAAGTPVPIDTIAKNFQIPSDWKASLRWEQQFDIGSSEDYTFTAQYLYTKTRDGFMWRNVPQIQMAQGVAPDGRPIYADLNDLGIDNVTELGNYTGGQNNIISLGLSKSYDNGLDFSLGYAHQDVEAVTEGTSSRGVSNWRGIIASDRNNPGVRPSPFQITHSLKFTLGYEKDFFNTGNSRTRFDMFFRRLSGDAYANTFDVSSGNALFGRARFESPFDDDSLYVPMSASDPAVVFATGFDQAAFSSYIKKHGGGKGILTPYNVHSSWNNVLDIRIQQEIPGLKFLGNSLGDNNFRVVLDIQNFLNLLNSSWGRWADGPGFLANNIVTADLVTAADVAANGVDGATALLGDAPRTNCTTQSACVYRFNSFNARSTSFDSAFNSVYQIRLGVRFDF
ncbi:MAG: TonB-dependent receptor [Woeseiaceae bacterium]